jgi:hypothetical protein
MRVHTRTASQATLLQNCCVQIAYMALLHALQWQNRLPMEQHAIDSVSKLQERNVSTINKAW